MMRPVQDALDQFLDFMRKGGFVMWPILALSLVTLALTFERGWFWIRLHGRRGRARFNRRVDALRRGQRDRVLAMAQESGDPFTTVGATLVQMGPTDANAVAASEEQRPRLDRYLGTFSTVVTAAPLFGILGTVSGIIKSFALLGGRSMPDPASVSHGIAEALVATASGLSLALVAVFPYMIFRAQADRAVGRLEVVIAAAQSGLAGPSPRGGASSKEQGDGRTQDGRDEPRAVGAAGR